MNDSKMNVLELERMFDEQASSRRLKVLEALTKDDRSTISITELANALGVPPQQLQNSAWCGLLPFGYGHHGENAKSRYTTILKDVFWNWYNNKSVQIRW